MRKEEPIYAEPIVEPAIQYEAPVQATPAPNSIASRPQKLEYEGVALVISSCVTYGTIMGDITFDRAKKTVVFDMNFNPIHQDAPAAHHTQLQFVWNPNTCQLVHAVESG